MLEEGELVCARCNTVIGKQKHVAFKMPFTKGDKPEHYLRYHARHVGDCYHQELRDQEKAREQMVKAVTPPSGIQ